MRKEKKQVLKETIAPNTRAAFEIISNLQRLEVILNSPIFTSEYTHHPLKESAFIEAMICLNDLLQKAKNASNADLRISFTDDVDITKDVKDVTDLVNRIRNAVCHIPSPLHYVIPYSHKATFGMAYGKGKLAYMPNDITLESSYQDDVAFFFGLYRIYLKRHIIRASNEAAQGLTPFIYPPF